MTDDVSRLMSPEEMAEAHEITKKILAQMNRVLLGREDLNKLVLTAVLSQGHVLLEGMPGLGKTELIKSLGQVLGLDFKRVQFTPDLMPGDILGAHLLQGGSDGDRDFVFKAGPVFTNILLADEINRASPKTQAALLEAMQEQCVTLLGNTRTLPRPFFVLASQNPIDLEGTYPLPEAQLDRFLFKLEIGGVNVDVMTSIIADRRRGEPPRIEWTASREELDTLFTAMQRILIPNAVCHYISRLVAASHPGEESGDHINQYVTHGASPRAAIAMAEAARARALMEGRPTAGFEDVRAVAVAVLNHRLITSYQARVDRVTTKHLAEGLLETVPETDLGLPTDMELAGERS
jgi:MoxR-like ATPase